MLFRVRIPIEMENMPSHTHKFNMNNDGNGISGDSKGLFGVKHTVKFLIQKLVPINIKMVMLITNLLIKLKIIKTLKINLV